jgi:YrbI family 3-deoxy-D-manno-octulosonate 8-phosphate phosphatase
MDEKQKNKLKNIKLLVMDVDGTLTDSSMYYTSDGDVMKKFSTRDGMGIDLMHKRGFQTAILTSETNLMVAKRAEKLNIKNVIFGARQKDIALKNLAQELSVKLEEIAYIGDDLNDIPAIKIAGFSACPNDASDYVKNLVDYVCIKSGGNGAVRELIEMIFTSQEIPLEWIA